MEGGDFSMSNIEERIVRMTLDSQTFASGASNLMSLLQALNKALKLEGASQGLSDVSSNLNKIDTSQPQGQVSALAAKFSALQVAAITALSNIVNRAVDAGLSLAKSLTIQPLVDGFNEYETQIGSIQTILANTGLKGAEGLNKVNDALNNLNHYADQTIYNFSEMTRNIGTFTAAGVSLDVATNAIKGIANLAAVSGSNAEQASAAMYQLSQALAAGKVTLEDWNSVVNAGMGGKVFQDSLIETARVHGVAVDKFIKDEGSFRLSLQKGWLTSGILTETLSKFTGELTADQLKSMGYNKQQIEGIIEMGKTATDAATKVKSMTQLLDTLREAVGSGWAKTWQIVFGDFDEAKDLFTGVNNVLSKMIANSSDARNKLLQDWKDLGGRDALIKGIANAFEALLAVLKPIREAFSQMFPAVTAKNLYDLTVAFRDFTANLKIGAETANNLRRTFAGFFAILGIGWDLIKAGAVFIGNLIGKFTGGAGDILRFTGNIGDFLVALRQTIQQGQLFTRFFNLLSKAVDIALVALKAARDLIARIFQHVDLSPVEDMLKRIAAAIKPSVSLSELMAAAFVKVSAVMQRLTDTAFTGFVKLWDFVQNVVKGIRETLGGAGGGPSAKGLLLGVNTAAIVAFISYLKKFFDNFKPAEFLDALISNLEAITGALKGMQHALNAAALLGIALAIGILAISMDKLAKIDNAGLTRAATAIAVLMGELAAAFVLFNKVAGTFGAAKLIVVSTALIRLGAALLILVTAVEKLSKLSWDELAKGLTGVLVLMGALVAGVKFLPGDIAGVVKTSTALVVLTVAIRNLVNAVE